MCDPSTSPRSYSLRSIAVEHVHNRSSTRTNTESQHGTTLQIEKMREQKHKTRQTRFKTRPPPFFFSPTSLIQAKKPNKNPLWPSSFSNVPILHQKRRSARDDGGGRQDVHRPSDRFHKHPDDRVPLSVRESACARAATGPNVLDRLLELVQLGFAQRERQRR